MYALTHTDIKSRIIMCCGIILLEISTLPYTLEAVRESTFMHQTSIMYHLFLLASEDEALDASKHGRR